MSISLSSREEKLQPHVVCVEKLYKDDSGEQVKNCSKSLGINLEYIITGFSFSVFVRDWRELIIRFLLSVVMIYSYLFTIHTVLCNAHIFHGTSSLGIFKHFFSILVLWKILECLYNTTIKKVLDVLDFNYLSIISGCLGPGSIDLRKHSTLPPGNS